MSPEAFSEQCLIEADRAELVGTVKNMPAYLRDIRHVRVLIEAGEYELAAEWQANLANHFEVREAA